MHDVPDNPGVNDDALGQVASLAEEHLALGAAPHPVTPPRHEPVAGTVRNST